MIRQEAIEKLTEELCKMIIEVLDNNFRSCINCINFNQNQEICNKYKQRPPAKIIAKACPEWSYDINDDIPF